MLETLRDGVSDSLNVYAFTAILYASRAGSLLVTFELGASALFAGSWDTLLSWWGQ